MTEGKPVLREADPKRDGWTLGERRTLVVGVTGLVTGVAVDKSTVTIEGITLPTRMSEHVKYLSLDYPRTGTEVVIDDFDDSAGEAIEHERQTWIRLVHDMHYARDAEPIHHGTMKFCQHPLCREASRGL